MERPNGQTLDPELRLIHEQLEDICKEGALSVAVQMLQKCSQNNKTNLKNNYT